MTTAALLTPPTVPAPSRRRRLRVVPAVPRSAVTVRVVDGGPVGPADLPRPDALELAALAGRMRIALVGPPVVSLAGRLAARWTVTALDDDALDVVVTTDPEPDRVRALRQDPRHPAVLAVLPQLAPSALVVALLDAGADGCLRGSEPAEVDAHLQAMDRRRRAAATR